MANPNYNEALKVILEALQKGFKYAYKCLKALLRFLGVILIDKIMRAIVLWYDKGHHKNVKTEKKNVKEDSGEINNLRTQLQAVQNQLQQKVAQNNTLQSNLEQAKQVIETRTSEIIKLKGIINNHANETNSLKTQISTLNIEINELRKHSVSPDYIAGTIVYAEGDACSNNLRKPTLKKVPSSLYEIHTNPGDLSEGSFTVLNPSNVSLVIQNRSVSLKACRIDSVDAEANMLVTLTPGKTHKEGSEWLVTEPAVIKIIKA